MSFYLCPILCSSATTMVCLTGAVSCSSSLVISTTSIIMMCPVCGIVKTHYSSGRRNWSQEQWSRWSAVVVDGLGNITKNCCSACSDEVGWYWRSEASVPCGYGPSRPRPSRNDADTGGTTISARHVLGIKQQRCGWLTSNIHCNFWDRFVDHFNEQCRYHHPRIQMENRRLGRNSDTDLLDLMSCHGGIQCRQQCPICPGTTLEDRHGRVLFQPNPQCIAQAFRPIWMSSKLALFGSDYDIWLAVMAFLAYYSAIHLVSRRVDQRVHDFASNLDLLCWASWLWDEYYEARTA